MDTHLAMGLVVFDKVSRHFAGHAVDVRHLVAEPNAVEFVRMLEQLGPESGGDELGLRTQLVDHVGDGLAMLGVQSLKKAKINTFVIRLVVLG